MSCDGNDSALKFDENAVCDRCGKFGAFLLDGKTLCADCVELSGACCPEFGGDDFWRVESLKEK
jgi:hypothetical protein